MTDGGLPNLLAKQQTEYLDALANKEFEQFHSTAKWLLASLLAVNGGAVLAVLNNPSKVGNAQAAGALFVAGIFFAMLNGWLLHWRAGVELDSLHNQLSYWRAKTVDGQRLSLTEQKFDDADRERQRWHGWIPAAGWLSAISFFVGASIAICGAHG